MHPHRERVVAEKKELDEKREKLNAFIGGQIFRSLTKDEQERMQTQYSLMSMYSEVLQRRIDNLPN